MRDRTKNVLEFILEHTLWLMSCAGGFYLVLRIRLILLYGAARLFEHRNTGSYEMALTDKWGFILIALGSIVCVVVIEYYYIHAKGFVDLISRFFVVTGIELLFVASLSVIVQLIIGIDARTPVTVLLFTAVLVSGALMVSHPMWLPKLFRRGSTSSHFGHP